MTEFGNKGSSPGFLRKPRGEAFTTLMPRENETETAREFDAENKTLAITERVAGRRSPLSELDYIYDEAGNRMATMTTDDGTTGHKTTLDTYSYDATYQVTGADYGAPVKGNSVSVPALTEKFTYDAVGNRIEMERIAPKAPPVITRYGVNNLNQYTQVGEFAPAHDRNGNLSGMGQWLYRFDAMNRLVSASNGQMTARFFYDAKNRCVARSYQSSGSALLAPSSTLTLNTYDNWNLLEERDGSGAQQARYVHGRKIDEIIVMVNKHGTFYPHHDVLGNVTMLTDRFGRLVERYNYSVAGQVAISDAQGQALTQSAVDNRWMFTGREWLQEVGLYDYRNRVYSAELGRFLQTDPIRFSAGDINIYRYVSNKILQNRDPLGLDGDSDLAAFTGLVGMTPGEAAAFTSGAAEHYARTGEIISPNGGTLALQQSGDALLTLSAVASGIVVAIAAPEIVAAGEVLAIELTATYSEAVLLANTKAADAAMNAGARPWGSFASSVGNLISKAWDQITSWFE